LLFVASGNGDVFILNSLPTQPNLIQKLETDQKVCIRGLTRSVNLEPWWVQEINKPTHMGGLSHNLMMASDVNGYITIFDIGN